MKNRNLYFITAILMLTIMFIFPIKIEAKTYVTTQKPNMIMEKEILEPGYVIDFSNSSYSHSKYSRYYIYLENELITDNCFGVEDTCLQQFVVEERMIFQRKISSEENANTTSYGINFYKLKPDEKLLTLDISSEKYWQDYVDEHYYKSGDIIKMEINHGLNTSIGYYVLDNQEHIIESGGFIWEIPGLIRLPQIDGKDVYWINHIIMSGGIYNYPTLNFIPFEYTEPKIELKCDKDKINYGEKTKCEVCIECTHVLNKLEFSMNQKDLKFSNFIFSNGITNTGNNNSIKLNITDNNICSEKKTIMTFDVESTKDTNYLDKIALKNLTYTDEILTGNYNDLDSNLNIISTNNIISNPKTGTRMIFIIIPIIILLIVGILSVFKKKNKATN